MSALDFLRAEGADLIVTSGGLGPTADDLTAEVVGRLRRAPAGARRGPRAAHRRDHRALRAAVEARPGGAASREPQAGDGARGRGRARPGGHRAGTRRARRRPGRRRASRAAARAAGELGAGDRHRAVRAARRRARRSYRQTMLRLFGIPESEIAETLRVAEREIGLDGLEITTCLRRGELEVVIRSTSRANDAAAQLVGSDRRAARRSPLLDGRKLDRGPGRSSARGKACRGGRVLHRRHAGRAPDRPAWIVELLRRRCGRLLERGQDRSCSASTRS